LGDQIVEIVVRLQNNIPAASAIAAARPAFGTVLLTLESDTTFSAMAGTGVYFDLVDEHFSKRQPEPELESFRFSNQSHVPRNKKGEARHLALKILLRQSVSGSRIRYHINAAAPFIKHHFAIRERKQGPVTTGTHILTRDKFRSALADKDASRRDELTAKSFYSQTLADAVASVPNTALTFLMCHKN
jgi:hypothetical protein